MPLPTRFPGIAGNMWEAAWLDPGTGESNSTASGTSASDTLTLQAPAFTADLLLHLKITGTATAVKVTGRDLPSAFKQEQNYPNPFNPTTVIRYAIPNDGNVTLRIYDVLGREVETLVNGVQKAGRYEVTFDGSRLASGVYFCKLSHGVT